MCQPFQNALDRPSQFALILGLLVGRRCCDAPCFLTRCFIDAARNLAKHRVSFDEASTVFADRLSLAIPDPDHSEDEDRWIIIGQSNRGRILVVIHTENNNTVRVISAREAERRERVKYEEARS